MKKYLISITLLFPILISAQQEQKSIELPDFVITGRQSVEVQSAQKKKPELITTLSQDFFTPYYSPEELPLLLSSDPAKIIPPLSSGDQFSGRLFFGAGRYTLPLGLLSLGKSFGNFLLSADLWGHNTRSYIPDAGYNTSGASLSSKFFVDTDSDLLPGMSVSLTGRFWRDNYKFFGSVNPLYERKTNRAAAAFSVNHDYGRLFNFNFGLNADFLSLTETDLNEKILSAIAGFKLRLGSLLVGADGKYQKQILNNNLSGIDDYDFYNFDGHLKISPSGSITLLAGARIAGNSSNSFFSPFGSLLLNLDEGLYITLSFDPRAENHTLKDFVGGNIYMMNNLTDNIFTEVKFDLKGSLNYEYQKLFSISAWGGYAASDNYPYYEDIFRKGFFDVMSANSVKALSGGLNVFVHPNLLGYLSGEFKYQNIKDADENFIPYKPEYSALISYGYDFASGIGIKLKYFFAQNVFADRFNTRPVGSYHNLAAGISYRLLNNLSLSADFQNIMNRSNFVFDGYQEKPLDFVLGVEYRW